MDRSLQNALSEATSTATAGSAKSRVVVVGAGFGGLTAAMRLGRVDAAVTVIDRRNHHLFQPLLYQVATAALSPAHLSSHNLDVMIEITKIAYGDGPNRVEGQIWEERAWRRCFGGRWA